MVQEHSGFKILGPIEDAADAGAAGEVLTSAGPGVPPVWGAAGGATSVGSYFGDSSANRAIAHGLGATPKIVFIYGDTNRYFHRIMQGLAKVIFVDPIIIGSHAVTAMDATNFYVGNAADYTQSANNPQTFNWVAIG